MQVHNPNEAERLMKEYADMIYRLALIRTKSPHDAEDIMQEVFLRYLKAHPVFESSEHEKAWLIRVTVNACKDCLKNYFRRNTVSLEVLQDCAPEMDDDRYRVLEAVWALPRQYRDVIYLHYYEGYRSEEIGKMLGISASAVRTRLQKARPASTTREMAESSTHSLGIVWISTFMTSDVLHSIVSHAQVLCTHQSAW